MSYAAFVSYSFQDQALAKQIADQLEERGLPVWFADAKPDGGQLPDTLADAIRQSACLLVVLTKSAARSDWVRNEIQYAKNNGVPVFPLVVEEIPQSESIWLQVGTILWQDGRRAIDFDRLHKNVQQYDQLRCPVVAVMNMKGGVGKTTLCANLFGSAYKEHDKSVLLVDLDPQANLSQLLVHQNTYLGKVERDESIISAFEAGRPLNMKSPAACLSKIVAPNIGPIDPAQIAYRVAFDPEKKKRFDLIVGQFELAKYTLPQNGQQVGRCLDYFQQFIAIAQRSYDLIVLDVSPSSSHITLGAMRAASHVLCPIRPDRFSLRGLEAMQRLMEELFSLADLPTLITIMNGVNASGADAGVETTIRKSSEFGPTLLKTIIPQSRHLLAKNYVATPDPYSKLAINAQGFYSGDIREQLKAASKEFLQRMKQNARSDQAGFVDASQAEASAQ